MTVMLLQRFASPHSTHSQKSSNEGVASTTGGVLSTSPPATSLSTPSPTPVPFLFLLESQESWETELGTLGSESCATPLPSCPPAADYPTRLGGSSFAVPASATSSTLNNPLFGGGNVSTLSNFINSNNSNNNNNNTNNIYNYNNNSINNIYNNNNNNNNNKNNNNKNVVILGELGQSEKGRKIGGEYQREKSEVEGWIGGGGGGGGAVAGAGAGTESLGLGVVCGGGHNCSGGVSAAAVAGGGFYGRLGASATAAGSTESAGTADSRTGAVAAANSAAAAAGQTRLDSQGVAMRYYRLWIYACNIVLLGSAVGFAAAVSRTLVFSGDPRRNLVPGVPRPLDPTALYAYLALATQLGLVQLLGCIAARRLSARLLNAYWVLLLALLFGDAVIGVAWVFRFERMRAELRPTLRLRLQLEYGKENRFSEQWDRLQRDFSCCGIAGHEDFEAAGLARLPQTCCPPPSPLLADIDIVNNGSETTCQHPYTRGCEDSLVEWLRKTADLLFVLGFCVIAFAKLCFLGILRYEIREMIQKIKLLREPPPPPPSAILGGSNSLLCTSPPFVQSFSQLGVSPVVDSILTTTTATHINNNNNNNTNSNNNNNSGAGAGARRTTLPMAALPSGNSSLLQQSDEYSGVRHPLLSSTLQDGGADSDTNSHCALILEETTPPSISTHSGCNSSNRPDKSNGNNNYEMREFNRRLLISNGGGPGSIATGPRNRRT